MFPWLFFSTRSRAIHTPFRLHIRRDHSPRTFCKVRADPRRRGKSVALLCFLQIEAPSQTSTLRASLHHRCRLSLAATDFLSVLLVSVLVSPSSTLDKLTKLQRHSNPESETRPAWHPRRQVLRTLRQRPIQRLNRGATCTELVHGRRVKTTKHHRKVGQISSRKVIGL